MPPAPVGAILLPSFSFDFLAVTGVCFHIAAQASFRAVGCGRTGKARPSIMLKSTASASQLNRSRRSTTTPELRKSSNLHRRRPARRKQQYMEVCLQQQIAMSVKNPEAQERECSFCANQELKPSSATTLLVETLKEWIDDVLCSRRVVVRRFFKDLSDGSVAGALGRVDQRQPISDQGLPVGTRCNG